VVVLVQVAAGAGQSAWLGDFAKKVRKIQINRTERRITMNKKNLGFAV